MTSPESVMKSARAAVERSRKVGVVSLGLDSRDKLLEFLGAVFLLTEGEAVDLSMNVTRTGILLHLEIPQGG